MPKDFWASCNTKLKWTLDGSLRLSKRTVVPLSRLSLYKQYKIASSHIYKTINLLTWKWWHKPWLKQLQMLTLENTKQLISNPYGGNRLPNHDLTKHQTMTPHWSIALEQNWLDHSVEILSLSRMYRYDFIRFQTTKFESHCQIYWTKSNSFKLLTFLIAKLVSKIS